MATRLRPMRVLFVTSECTPFAMTGGLGDVSAALPAALRARGIDVRIVMPLYRCVDRRSLEALPGRLLVPVGDRLVQPRVFEGLLPSGVPVYLLDHAPFYDRCGIYGEGNGSFDDNLQRFALLSRGCIELCKQLGWAPHVVHCNDWQTALVPVYLDAFERRGPLASTATVLTVHNIGFQGIFPVDALAQAGLGREHLYDKGLEFFGAINLLKAGLQNATMLSTVSPSHAQEIQADSTGCGLGGVLRSRAADLMGILNGIDTTEWDPSTDPLLPARYSFGDLGGKAACKADLQKEAGLPARPEVPLLGITTRLSHQKGSDVLARSLPRILEACDLQVVTLGAGDSDAEALLRALSVSRPERLHAWIGEYDVRLAHRIEAASDFFLMPSRYEPCGLSQMYSMRYGCLPIVRATGGLIDTVDDYVERTGQGTGFVFRELDPASLLGAVKRAVATWYNRPRHVEEMRLRGMQRDFSWDESACAYENLYVTACRRQQNRAASDWSKSETAA